MILADLIMIFDSHVISFSVKGALMTKTLSREKISDGFVLIDNGSCAIIDWFLIDSENVSLFVDTWTPISPMAVDVLG